MCLCVAKINRVVAGRGCDEEKGDKGVYMTDPKDGSVAYMVRWGRGGKRDWHWEASCTSRRWSKADEGGINLPNAGQSQHDLASVLRVLL